VTIQNVLNGTKAGIEMTAFDKAWGVVKGDSCLTCGKKIDNPDELDHHHGHTWDSQSGPYCDQDCWVAGEKYNPHGGSK